MVRGSKQRRKVRIGVSGVSECECRPKSENLHSRRVFAIDANQSNPQTSSEYPSRETLYSLPSTPLPTFCSIHHLRIRSLSLQKLSRGGRHRNYAKECTRNKKSPSPTHFSSRAEVFSFGILKMGGVRAGCN